jgi:hypothetical protein
MSFRFRFILAPALQTRHKRGKIILRLTYRENGPDLSRPRRDRRRSCRRTRCRTASTHSDKNQVSELTFYETLSFNITYGDFPKS